MWDKEDYALGCLSIFAILFEILLVAAIAFVAIHFIVKYW